MCINRTPTRFLFAALILLALAGCKASGSPEILTAEPTVTSAPSPTPSTVSTPTHSTNSTSAPLATPIADSPAAGICGEMEGEVVTMTIFPDIPDPRCLRVRGEQRLRVVNLRGEPLEISLGGEIASLQPGEEFTFMQSFGELLQPGVHALGVSPCCGGEIVLVE